MSHRHVEAVIGCLVSDERFRRLFQGAANQVPDDLEAAGVVLTALERNALLATPADAWTAIADSLDPRLQKASLRREDSDADV